MNLLAGTYYDPAVAANKVATALTAMSALDTTNLRLTFTAPPSGRVLVKLRGGCVSGAVTWPQILVGCVEVTPAAGTVRGRIPPFSGGFNGTAVASTQLPVFVEYLQVGLTPGQAYTWDAAMAVEVLVAATGWRYGGPNTNVTSNDAFGGISFEIWDPSPLYTPASGAAPTSTAHVKIDAIQADTDNIQTRIPAALVGGRMDSSTGAMAADVLTAAATAADFGTEIGTAVWATATRALTDKAGFSLTQAFPANFASLSITVGGLVDITQAAADKAWGTAARTLTSSLDPTAAQIRAEIDTNSAGLAAIFARTDVATSTRLATAGYTAPDNASITAIKAKTDSLTFTVAGKLDVNVLVVNGVTLQGAGTALNKWRAV